LQRASEVVKELYEAFARGDVAHVLGQFAPDVVWNEAESFPYADRNPYVGPQAVLEGVFLRLGTEWDGFSVHLEQIVGSDDTAVGLGRYRGTHKATGVAVDAQFAHVWSVSGGKITRFQQYTDTAQFRDATTRSHSAGV
jgi:ketosteroid isomerase-like protein